MKLADPAQHGFDPKRLDRIDVHFQRYIDDRRLNGWQIVVSRGGHVVHHSTAGLRDRDEGIEWTEDSIVRMFSMTKPVTSVAAMMLYEEGAFELKDPVSKFIPSFADSRVYRSGSAFKPVTEPVTEPVRIWHLLTHTSGSVSYTHLRAHETYEGIS